MSSIPGETTVTVQVADMQALVQAVNQLISVWATLLNYWMQMMVLQMLFGLLYSFITSFRPPTLGVMGR